MKFFAVGGILCRVTSIELQLQVKRLKKQLAERDAIIADRDAKIARLTNEFAKLQTAVKQLLAQRRGGSSIPAGQGLLFAETPAIGVAPASAESTDDDSGDDGGDDDEDDSRGRHRSPPRGARRARSTPLACRASSACMTCPRSSASIRRQGSPSCRSARKFEELDYIRARLVVIVHRRPVYGLPPDEAAHRQMAPVTADLPPLPLENCAASASLLAWQLVQKYGNHLPLYRQQAIFERDGLRIPRQTQCDWALAAVELLAPLVVCSMAKIRAGPVMQLDDTPIMCQGGRGEPHFQACLWTFVNPEVGGVVYRFTPGRASESLAAEIGNFRGWLVSVARPSRGSTARWVPAPHDARRRSSTSARSARLTAGREGTPAPRRS